MSCARIARLSLAVFVLFALGVPAFGQEMSADGGCGLPAVNQGIDVGEVCNKLGVSYRSIYGPDRSPWIEIASASDCDRVRAELDRVLSGQTQAAPPESEAEPPRSETAALPARRETDLERWLRRNGYASLDEAQADSAGIEKKRRLDRQNQEQAARQAFAGHMRRFEAELKERIAGQEALVAAELERKKQAAQETQAEGAMIPAEAWAEPMAKWRAEQERVNKEIETTRQALLKLVKGAEADVKLFNEWELEAQAGLERSWKAIFDLAMDAGMGMFAEGANGWAAYAKGPGAKASPETIEEYFLLFSLINRLKEAKSIRDLSSFAANEGKTGIEVLEMVRDGLVQLSGLLGVEETFPGRVLKYGALLTDQAYNYTALFQVWKNIGILDKNSAAKSEAIQKLSERLRQLVDRQKELAGKFEAGEKIEFQDK